MVISNGCSWYETQGWVNSTEKIWPWLRYRRVSMIDQSGADKREKWKLGGMEIENSVLYKYLGDVVTKNKLYKWILGASKQHETKERWFFTYFCFSSLLSIFEQLMSAVPRHSMHSWVGEADRKKMIGIDRIQLLSCDLRQKLQIIVDLKHVLQYRRRSLSFGYKN